jgi:hypothetical protein
MNSSEVSATLAKILFTFAKIWRALAKVLFEKRNSKMVFQFLLSLIALKPSACEAEQGCQMVYFQTKNPNLGKFWRALIWKMLV